MGSHIVSKVPESPEYVPPFGWRYKGSHVSEDEAESICRDLCIPFCIEKDAVETTFLIRTAIAGTQFVEGFEELTDGIQIGEVLELRRMPRNRYDSASVSVRRNGSHVGYVPRVDNRVIAGLMDSGHNVAAVVAGFDDGKVVIDLSSVSGGRRLYRHFSEPFGMEFVRSEVCMEHRPFGHPSPFLNGYFTDFQEEPVRFEYRRGFG